MSDEKFDSEIEECIDASIEAAEIINELIHNTLEFSRKSKESFDSADLNKIIEKAISITKGISNQKNISFSLDLDNSISPITVNETSILQVFVNVISNSIEASPLDSEISIMTYMDKDKICAEVIDIGIGIEEEEQDKIFEEFYTNKESGTGLGLHVCKTILDNHNASYSLVNNNLKGTKFKVMFDMNSIGEL
jgi:signal transduction histidine kinase